MSGFKTLLKIILKPLSNKNLFDIKICFLSTNI